MKRCMITKVYDNEIKHLDKILYKVPDYQSQFIAKSSFMDLPQSSSTTPTPEAEPIQNVVHIDESWIQSSDMVLKYDLIICPVCYGISVDFAVECSKCDRIFCKNCFDKVSQSQNGGDKKCPNCQSKPWKKKEDIHISYKNIFESLRFNCKICKRTGSSQEPEILTQKLTKDGLKKHLLEKHNMTLSSHTSFYDFVLISKEGEEIKLSWLQNVEINYKKNLELERFSIGAPASNICKINLKDMTAFHPIHKDCKLKCYKSQTFQRNKVHHIWIVNLLLGSEAARQRDQSGLQINQIIKEQEVFYSEQYQSLIEENYQNFVNNNKRNVFCLDTDTYRYIINFKERKQINSFIKSIRNIKRISVVFK